MTKFFWNFAAICWLLAVVAAFAGLFRFTFTPGEKGHSNATWPSTSRISRAMDRFTLVAFLHSRCPCSSATLSELERLMPHLKRVLPLHIVLMDPAGMSPLADRLSRIPGLVIHRDAGRQEADLFGAATGGHVFFYSPEGSLLFEGGITPGRGHEGASTGQQLILAALKGSAARASADVFGCPLAEVAL